MMGSGLLTLQRTLVASDHDSPDAAVHQDSVEVGTQRADVAVLVRLGAVAGALELLHTHNVIAIKEISAIRMQIHTSCVIEIGSI